MQTNSTSQEQWTFEDLYNMLMWDIEPELTTDALPYLEMLYADETEQERKARMEWYAKALEMASEKLSLITDIWKQQIETLKEDILGVARSESDENDTEHMSDIERQISEEE